MELTDIAKKAGGENPPPQLGVIWSHHSFKKTDAMRMLPFWLPRMEVLLQTAPWLCGPHEHVPQLCCPSWILKPCNGTELFGSTEVKGKRITSQKWCVERHSGDRSYYQEQSEQHLQFIQQLQRIWKTTSHCECHHFCQAGRTSRCDGRCTYPQGLWNYRRGRSRGGACIQADLDESRGFNLSGFQIPSIRRDSRLITEDWGTPGCFWCHGGRTSPDHLQTLTTPKDVSTVRSRKQSWSWRSFPFNFYSFHGFCKRAQEYLEVTKLEPDNGVVTELPAGEAHERLGKKLKRWGKSLQASLLRV